MAAQSTQFQAMSAASHHHHYSNGNNDGGHAADADPPSCVTHQPWQLSQCSSKLCALQTMITAMMTTPARTTTSVKMMTSTRTIAKMTPATATKKMIAMTMAPPTMTPNSCEDNIFCKDNNSHKVNCEDDTCNGDSEDNRCYDHALLVTGYDVLLSTLQGNLSFSTSSVSSFASTHAGPDYFSLLDLHLRHRTLSDSCPKPSSRVLPHGQPRSFDICVPFPP